MNVNVVVPMVHINGTNPEDLVECRSEAYVAISEAIDAMRKCNPNGRDFYPVPGMMQMAERQARRRMEALRGILDELEREIELIDGCELGLQP